MQSPVSASIGELIEELQISLSAIASEYSAPYNVSEFWVNSSFSDLKGEDADTPIQGPGTAPVELANAGITSSVVESLNFVAGKKVGHQTDVPKAPYRGPSKTGV